MSGEPLIDQAMLDRLHEWGGEELRGKMVDLFFENGRERMNGVRDGLARNDVELAGRSAHSLKSSAATLGAERVRSVAGRIETMLEEGDTAGAAALVSELDERFEEALVALEPLRSAGGRKGTT